jgi:mono/diheme cytochrome c family protein
MHRSSVYWSGAILLVSGILFAQVTIKKVPIASTSAASGGDMFQNYCASCHGADAKGQGPASAALKVPATDLTALARHNNGEFPAQYIMYTLSQGSGSTRAHGSDDMPVWGEVFRASGQGSVTTQIRIYNLMRYLEAIQDVPPAQQAAPKPKETKARVPYATEIHAGSGSAMFQAYCASCHGADGRGSGPASATLKAAAPDLTLLAKQNAGRFPDEKVRSILGWQRGTTAHGSKDMPVWGELLRTSREGEEIVLLRLRNILRYVESIQR